MPQDAQHFAAPTQSDAIALRYGAPLDGVAPGNAVIDALLSHRSVRAYLPDALPDGTTELLIAAAQSAATSSNMQLWSVIAVEDPARRARLSALANNQKHITEAPLFLLWLADLSRAERLGAAAGVEMEGLPYTETFMVAMIDAALAAQNATVAAESLGLGTVYIGSMRNHPEAAAAELGLPPQCMVAFGLCVGFPDPAKPAPIRPRLPQSVVLHHERYDASVDATGIALYDQRFTTHQHAVGLPPNGWISRVIDRLGTAAGLGGRDTMRQALKALGFPLD